MSKRRYTPAEICEIFAVSKSTLFRWEQEAVIPPVPRDEKHQRLYTSEHVRAISRRQGDVLRRPKCALPPPEPGGIRPTPSFPPETRFVRSSRATHSNTCAASGVPSARQDGCALRREIGRASWRAIT